MMVIAVLADAMEKAEPLEKLPVRAPERAMPVLPIWALAQLPVIGGSAFDERRIVDLIGSDLFQLRPDRASSAPFSARRATARPCRGTAPW